MHKNSVVYQCTMSYSEDPYVLAAEPLYEWKQTEHGAWCEENCQGQMTYHCAVNPSNMGYTVIVTGDFTEKDLVYMYLRWGKP